MMRNDPPTHRKLHQLITAEQHNNHDETARILAELIDTTRDAAALAMLLARTAGAMPHLVHHLLDTQVMPLLIHTETAEQVAAVQLIAALANDDLDLAFDITQAAINVGQDHAMQVILTLLAFAAEWDTDSTTDGTPDGTTDHQVPIFGVN